MAIAELTNSVLEVVLITILPIIMKFLIDNAPAFIKKYNEKVDNEIIREYINYATQAILNSVSEVSQTYVDNLKSSGEFNSESAKQAFILAKDKAEQLMSDEVKKAIGIIYGDIDVWIGTVIEKAVRDGN